MPGRVAHVISTRGVGGAERFLANLIQQAEPLGWEQVLLNPFDDGAAADLPTLFHPALYKGHPCDSLRGLPAVRRWLKEELAAFRPGVVHVILPHALIMVATLRRTPRQRWLLTHMYGEGIRIKPHGRLRTDLDRWAGKRFDYVVGISEAVQRFLVSDYRYPPSKVGCIPLGWHGRPLPATRDGYPPTIVCVANLRPEKGHAVLLDAFSTVRRQIPEARLVLVGDGELRDDLAAKVSAMGLDGSVEMTGAVPHAWPYLARAHVFALASLSEAFGIAVVEAMAAGLPVVASDVGGIPELVTAGVTGELFPPGDAQVLASHLVRILGDRDAAAAMGDAARVAAEPHHASHTIPRYLDVWERLLQGRDLDQVRFDDSFGR